MPDFRLRIGILFTSQDRVLTIDQTLPDGRLCLKDLLSGESSAIEPRELVKDLFEGKIELGCWVSTEQKVALRCKNHL